MKQNHKNKKQEDTVQQISKSDIFLRRISEKWL